MGNRSPNTGELLGYILLNEQVLDIEILIKQVHTYTKWGIVDTEMVMKTYGKWIPNETSKRGYATY
ncbi:hypothetical protein lpari_03958 [Legionella parisiensis]|uniref:Uncharacterized protein n=1 Tax=Legionella parisiensis TaxID=45071 RepID=A0A1E5JKR4_9GAMM|nr:hypothetical protein [Legionella parisiensis]OEH45070.1 hypothetical protein lpari_03958 [Legionella parisiensis]